MPKMGWEERETELASLVKLLMAAKTLKEKLKLAVEIRLRADAMRQAFVRMAADEYLKGDQHDLCLE